MAVIIVPFGTGIGDLVLQRPLLKAVQRAYPGQRVQLYAPRSVQPLTPAGIDVVPRILGIPAWRRVGSERAWRVLGPLEERSISLLFDHLPVVRASRLPGHLLRESRRYDTVIDLMAAFLDTVDFDRDWLPPPAGSCGPHLSERLATRLAAQGIHLDPSDSQPLDIRECDLQLAERVREQYPGGDFVLIHPHSGSSLKTKPYALWLEIVAEAGGRGLLPLITPGTTAAEAAAARAIAGTNGRVLPRMPLLALGALARKSKAIIAPDTGLLSVAANVGAPWVGLFGATNPWLIGPRQTETGIALVSGFQRESGCGRCWQRFVAGSGRCAVKPGSSCLEAFSAAEVLEAVARLPVRPVEPRHRPIR